MAFTKIAAAGIGSTGTVTLENLVVTGSITASLTGTATSTTNIPNLTGAITSNNTTTSLGSFSSANLSAALTDETGSGAAVFATSPTLTTVTVSSGGINVTGVSTLGNTVIGGGTTQLVVTGNARITGILTIGTSSITLDGSNNQLNVGTGVTLHHTNGVQVGGNTLHSTGLTLNSLTATGVSTFTNGPILVGTATSTGTASQRLQVTGGAYVSGNLGVGTTNPTAKLQVVGDTRVSGVVTAFDFYNDAEYPSVRPTLDLAFAQTKILDSRITFTRASTATYVNAFGLIASAAVNEARFDHDPYTGESLGLLVEEARTNLFTNSNPWAGGSNITWTSSQVSPTGGTESYNMVETAANNIHGLSILGGGFTTDYNRHISVFAKSAGRRYLVFWAALGAYPGADSPECIFDLQSGTVVYLDTGGSGGLFETASITNFGNGWYRCGIYLNPYTLANRNLYILMSNSASPQQSSYTGDGSSGVTLFGLQVEAGAFPTSYIPTSGSTVTRSADVASMTGTNFSSWYNQSESTFYTNYILFGLDASYNNPSFYAYENNQNYLAIFGHNPAYGWAQASNATAAGISLGGTTTTNVDYKVSFGVKVNDFAASINGSTVSTDTSGNVPTVSQMFLGKRVEASAAHLNGTLKRFTYYPKRLSNTQLQTITL